MIIVSCGIGNDSIALLIEAQRRNIRPDAIIFANTGSEHPRTIAYIETLNAWLKSVAFPLLTVVRWIRRDGSHTPLHEVCEARKELPSQAYGYAGCSDKWKRQPIDRWVRRHPEVIDTLQAGGVVERWIGFNADEHHRFAGNRKDDVYLWRAPLVEWDIGRDEVRQIIRCSALPLPGKSACWLCPNMRAGEVRDLQREHPGLFRRALAIERNADLVSIRGLGRRWSWAELVQQPELFDTRSHDTADMPCMCAT